MNKDWVDTQVLEDYLDGKLDGKAMHFVERLSLEDPFVAEALEGLSKSPKRKQYLSLLQKQLHERINQEPVRRKLWGIGTQRISIAAAAAVLFISASLVFWMKESNRRALEHREGKQVDVQLTPLPENSGDKKIFPDDPAEAVIDKAIAENKNKIAGRRPAKSVAPVIRQDERRPADVQGAAIASASMANAEAISAKGSYDAKTSAALAITKNARSVETVRNAIVTGIVVDEDGTPIPGASVKLRNNPAIGMSTDISGRFSLRVDSLRSTEGISVAYLGFKRAELPISLQEPIRITLKRDSESLEGVVVTAGGVTAKRREQGSQATTVRASQLVQPISPQGGIEAFQAYLLKNNKLLNKNFNGIVSLEFSINIEGRPEAIKVVKSLNREADREAIRLVQSGPKWIKADLDSKNPVRLDIRF